jgi:hypothetical protein
MGAIESKLDTLTSCFSNFAFFLTSEYGRIEKAQLEYHHVSNN